MRFIHGALTILFGAASLYALAITLWLATQKQWRNAGILTIFVVILGMAAANYYEGSQGRPVAREDPSVPRLK